MSDYRDYFNTRLTQEIENGIEHGRATKYDELQKATQDKIKSLTELANAKAIADAQYKKSLAGSWGLEQDSKLGNTVNIGASFVEGGFRVAGQLASLVPTMVAGKKAFSVPDEAKNAYARMQAGEASEADISLLNLPSGQTKETVPGEESILDLFDQAKRLQDHDTNTNLQTLRDSAKAALIGQTIKDKFDLTGLVDRSAQNNLVNDLGEGYDTNTAQASKGWESLKNGEVASGATDLVSGLAGALVNIGDAAVKNPQAATEYIANNLPQIGLALAGTPAMAASNAAYAISSFGDGLVEYQKKNNGAMPSQGELAKMATLSASLALAETVGDKLVIGKGLTKVGHGADDAARSGLKKALLGPVAAPTRIAGAGLQGATGEFVTEAYQTFAENEIKGEETTLKDAYIGGSIGAIAGGGISAGIHTLGEITNTTEEKVKAQEAKAADNQEKAELFKTAVETNNPSAFLDPKNPNTYNPAAAITALAVHTKQEGVTEEVKTSNLEKANQIVADLENTREAYQGILENTSPKGIAALEAQAAATKAELAAVDPADTQKVEELTQSLKDTELDLTDYRTNGKKIQEATQKKLSLLDEQIKAARANKDAFHEDASPKIQDVSTQIAALDTEVDPADTEIVAQRQASADVVIKLAMASPDRVDAAALSQLANNSKNGLSEGQREFLRTFTAAQENENKLKSMDSVSQEIFHGVPVKRQLGIADYRKRMAEAIAAGNKKAADYSMKLLNNFVSDHSNKAALATELFNRAQATGNTFQMIKNAKTGRWEEATEKYSLSTLKKNGGLEIHKNSDKADPGKQGLISSIQFAAKALQQTQENLKAGYALKFTGSTQPTAVNSNTPVNSQATTVASPNQLPNQSKVDSTVNTLEASTTPSVEVPNEPAPSQPVVEAAAIGSSENNSGTTTVVEDKPKKKRKDASTQDNIVGTILRLTGGRGIDRKYIPDVVKDAQSLGSLRPLFKNGGEGFDWIVRQLHVENEYELGALDSQGNFDEVLAIQNLQAMLADHRTNPVYSRERTTEEAQRAEEKAYKEHRKERTKEVNSQAADIGLKGISGGRTLEKVEEEIKEIESQFGEFSEWDTRVYNFLESIVVRLIQSGMSEKDANQILSKEFGFTVTLEEVLNDRQRKVANRYRKSQEATAKDAQGKETENGTNGSETSVPEGREETPAENSGRARNEGQLTLLKDKAKASYKKIGEVFHQINLFSQFFTQRLQKDTDKTPRPLVAVKDFLSQWNAGQINLAEFVGYELSSKQEEALNNFKQRATQWMKHVQANLSGNKKEEYRFQDPIQFLIEKSGNEIILEENIKLAIVAAAYGYLAENGNAPEFKNEEEVKAQFGLKEHDKMEKSLVNALAGMGTRDKVLHNALGQKVIQMLGLQTTAEASKDLLPALQADIGAHAAKVLMDIGVLEYDSISNAAVQAGLPDHLRAKNPSAAPIGFLRVARDTSGAVHPLVSEIVEANKGTRSVLNTLMGSEPDMRAPTWEPVSFKETVKRGLRAGTPKKLANIIDHENKVPNFVRQDLWGILNGLDQEHLYQLLGIEEIDEDTTHAANLIGLKAKRDAAERTWLNFSGYVASLESSDKKESSPLGLSQPLYFEHEMWSQQRVGISTNLFNPQADKTVRHLLYRKAWETEVSIENPAMVENLLLRIAEGLGIKTDKQGNELSVANFHALFDTTSKDQFGNETEAAKKAKVIIAAVDALIDQANGEEMTADRQAAVVAGVKAGGEKLHSLDALVTLAEFSRAKTAAKGKPYKITSRLMGEVDGVTNGPMLSHLMLGAASTVDDLFGLLNKGGFYRVVDGFKNYNIWRGSEGHNDLYETVIASVMEEVRSRMEEIRSSEVAANFKEYSDLLASVFAITGTLEKDGKIQKAGRNIIKTPLTAMLFGSALKGSIENMFDDFVGSIHDHIEKIAKMSDDKQDIARVELIKHINVLLGKKTKPVALNTSIEDLLALDLMKDTGRYKGLKDSFMGTLGGAVHVSIEKGFKSFIDTRSTVNSLAQYSFSLFEAAHGAISQDAIRHFAETGELATNAKTGKPITDLTLGQEELVLRQLGRVTPVVHTLMSKESGELDNGLPIAKMDRKISTRDAYSPQVQFARPLPNGAKNLTTSAYEMIMGAPGVRMLPMMIHSLDSFISHTALKGREVLNVHDAHGTGLAEFTQTAQALNKATWEATLKYSPVTEMRDAWKRTVLGLADLIATNPNNATLHAAVSAAVAKQAEGKKGMTLLEATQAAYAEAFRADTIRLTALSQMGYVDQYALEGGQYEVTDADRQAALDALAKLEKAPSAKVLTAVEAIQSYVSSTKPQAESEVELTPNEDDTVEPSVSQWGVLGTSATPSHPKIMGKFKTKPVMSVKEVAEWLAPMLQPHNRAMLAAIVRLTPDTKIKLIQRDTPESEVLEHFPGARGWFIAKNGRQEIYVLSDEFVASGLTQETLLHEMLHGALAQTIEAELQAKKEAADRGNGYTSPALELVQDLEELRSQAAKYVEKSAPHHAEAVKDVHELVSWGMFNKAFQEEVLEKIQFTSNTGGNRFITGMKKFISIITNALGISSESQNKNLGNLIRNVSGLLAAAAERRGTLTIRQGMVNPASRSYTTSQLYDALGTGQSTDAFDQHLRTLLDGMVEKLHGPFGTFKASRMENQSKTPQEIFDGAVQAGIAPFVSKLHGSGFVISKQEAFVLEQVEATIQVALDNNEGFTSTAYSELSKLFVEMRGRITPQDFHAGDWAQATTSEKANAKALHDFIFKIERGTGTRKSDYLARFAAMTLAHQGFHTLMDRATARDDKALSSLPMSERVATVFERILNWVRGVITHTRPGQQANEKVGKLVDQLILIEARKQQSLTASTGLMGGLESSMKSLSDAARNGIESVATSKFVTNSKNGFVKAAGGITSTIIGNRTDFMIDGITRLYNKTKKDRQSVLEGLLNEIQGMTDANKAAHLLHQAAQNIQRERKDIATNTRKMILNSFANNGQDLTGQDKEVISQIFLRSNLQVLLDTHTPNEIQVLLSNSAARKQAIRNLERKLTGSGKLKALYLGLIKTLAYYNATEKTNGPGMLKNAKAISRLYGTRHAATVSTSAAESLVPTIDQLISLYSLEYAKTGELNQANQIMSSEMSRGEENGIIATLKVHKHLLEESKKRIFKDNEVLMMNGYLPEIYDTSTDVRIAGPIEGAELVAQGYVRGLLVQVDPADPDKTPRHMYIAPDAGMPAYTTGAFSITGTNAKGSRDASQGLDSLDSWIANQEDLVSIFRKHQKMVDDYYLNNPDFDPSKVEDRFSAPVLDNQGGVANYNYLMQRDTKDVVLKRDNRFDKLLGALAGNIYDKETSAEHNATAVQALKDQWNAEQATRSDEYVVIGETSTNEEFREIYRMLPDSTKDQIALVWGGKSMRVRRDLLDLHFGYRKFSLGTVFDQDPAARNFLENAWADIMTALLGKKAKLRIRRVEGIWQAVVQETKDIIVIKTGYVLLGNMVSNLSSLLISGVSIKHIIHYHQVALKGALSYRADHSRLNELRLQLDAGTVPGQESTIRQEILRLEDALARNPVAKLIEAGMMPTIVEDVSLEDDYYSYKSRLVRTVESKTTKMPTGLKKAARFMYMARDTQMYRVLSYGTQVSDFMARYTLYQHKTKHQKSPMSVADAKQHVLAMFVNYDIPSHSKVQFMNDMGFWMFTKYLFRIQKVLALLYRDQPARALGMLALGEYFGRLSLVTDGSIITGNHTLFHDGALKFPKVLDNMLTMNVALAPFK